jgi:hypothetical protein
LLFTIDIICQYLGFVKSFGVNILD